MDSSSLSPSSSVTMSSSVSPSSLSHNWIHDVFPSFRGEDVRNNFLSHVQKEFQRKGITLFIDNKIKRGESIGPELIRAIRESKISIILLSWNYASSKWCLNELVEIMNCREILGRTVIAIFYKVDPSDVKNLSGDFGEVFRKTCAGRSEEDIDIWRQAFTKLATVAGYHLNNWDNEAAMIERIATDISNELINSVPSNDCNSLIGMRTHMENIKPFLRLGSYEARMIGIWGPSGIGKSTIARFLYNEYANQFQLCVFMENMKTRYPRACHDRYSAKLQLHKEFLSQIINQEDVKINHLGVIQERLKNQRVFVVLDDVDHLLQLEATVKETLWFSPGSRIIITTQDKKILKQHKINHIYEVGFPRNNEALQIFCMHAFGQSSPYEGFEDLAWKATQLSGNLPLGLRVMGSHFKGMSKDEWKKELPRLKNSLDGEIESILKFSYNALLEEDKCLFLYIACFFDNEQMKKVEAHLAENFVDVKQGLHVLAEKSLISIFLGSIRLHGLLKRLGRKIVGEQSIQDRQFLNDGRDICKVLSNDTVCNSVTVIECKHYEVQDELYKIHYWMDLSYSKDLKELPNLSTATNLEKLDLRNCSSLLELPFPVGNARNLQTLNLKDCSSLVKLSSFIGNAINLVTLDLEGCSNLVELPSSIGNAINLDKMYIGGCKKLVSLPKLQESLSILGAKNCESLERLDFYFRYKWSRGELNFAKCFKLNEEARDLIMTSPLKVTILPGVKVPTKFTYKAIGNSVSVVLDVIDTHVPRSLNFKACFLLVYKGDIEIGDKKILSLPNCIHEKHNDINVMRISSFLAGYLKKEHLYIFNVTETTASKELVFKTSNELVFKFEVDEENWEIGECGIYMDFNTSY